VKKKGVKGRRAQRNWQRAYTVERMEDFDWEKKEQRLFGNKLVKKRRDNLVGEEPYVKLERSGGH